MSTKRGRMQVNITNLVRHAKTIGGADGARLLWRTFPEMPIRHAVAIACGRAEFEIDEINQCITVTKENLQ